MQELQGWMQNGGEGRGPYEDDTGYLGRSCVAGGSLWSNGSRTATGFVESSSATSLTDDYELSANGWDDSDGWDGFNGIAGCSEFADGGAAGPDAEL
jgi:hypothetical protein